MEELTKEQRTQAKEQLSLLFDYNVFGISNDAVRTAIKALDMIGELTCKIHRLEQYDEQRDTILHKRLIEDTKKETVVKVLSDIRKILTQSYYTKNDDIYGDLQVFDEEDINTEFYNYALEWGIKFQ